mgnify:CR=1 FL=1
MGLMKKEKLLRKEKRVLIEWYSVEYIDERGDTVFAIDLKAEEVHFLIRQTLETPAVHEGNPMLQKTRSGSLIRKITPKI